MPGSSSDGADVGVHVEADAQHAAEQAGLGAVGAAHVGQADRALDRGRDAGAQEFEVSGEHAVPVRR